ncbi:hypothetical protein IT575_02735 [bacterium]|nr:hypothetical protein [bacterium]
MRAASALRLSLCMVLMFCSCGGDGVFVGAPINDTRWVLSLTYGVTTVEFSEGVAVGPIGTQVGAKLNYLVAVQGSPGDHAVISKAEINWGDGGGFQDCTDDARNKWWSNPAASEDNPAYLTVHTYNTPGEYTITGRVTYWDGVVVTEDESTRSKLRIVE